MNKKTLIYHSLIFFIFIFLTKNQSCDLTGTPIPITSVISSSLTLTFATNNNVATGTWLDPGYTTSYITVKGWSSSNGSLIQLTFAGNASVVNASIGPGSGGVIKSSAIVGNNQLIVNFAQKDDSHNNFYIAVTSKNVIQTIRFTLTLTQRGYNNVNGSCDGICAQGTGVQFYIDNNGNQNNNQFICWQKNIFVSIIGLMITFFIF